MIDENSVNQGGKMSKMLKKPNKISISGLQPLKRLENCRTVFKEVQIQNLVEEASEQPISKKA